MASTTQTINLTSSDNQTFQFKPEFLKKANMLKQMLSDLGFEEEGSYPEEGIPLPSVEGEALGKILKWLEIHANEEPRSEEERQMHRFNRNVAKEDNELFDTCEPRPKLAAVINAAYYLEMPDLTDSLIKYTANNLEGKEAAKMAEWLAIPLKKDERKKEAEDKGEEGLAVKKGRD